MQALYEMGVSLTVRGKEGLTALHHAARHNRREAVRWLTQKRKAVLALSMDQPYNTLVSIALVPREALDLVDDDRLAFFSSGIS